MGVNPSPYPSSGGFTNPMTTAGDLIDATTGGTAQRLAVGSANQVLTVSGGAPSWQNNAAGFANPMTTAGDVIIENATPTPARLAIGSAGQVLTPASGLPAWANPALLFPTAVKTAGYTAASGDLVPVDTTSGSVTVTLPAAPADRTTIGVKQVIQGGTNTVTVAAGGSDVFNVAGGTTTRTLTLLFQAILVQYKASSAIWYVIADDLPLTQLDSRYAQVANNLSDLAARQTAINNLAGAQTANQVLRGNGTNIVLGALAAADLPTGTTSAQGALQLDGTAGDIANTSTAAAAGAVGKAADAGHTHKQGCFTGVFGDGSDSSVTLDGVATPAWASLAGSTYTLSRDIHMTALTVNNAIILVTAGFRIFCQGTVTNNGTISNNGGNGNANGTAGTGTTQGTLGGAAAAGAGQTTNGTSVTNPSTTLLLGVGQGGNAGAGSGGTAGNGGTIKNATTYPYRTPFPVITGYCSYAGTGGQIGPGTAGGGGGGDTTNKGGGGGGGGGPIVICAWAVNNGSGTISSTGGNGGSPGTGNCGGGGGGGGGIILIYTLAAWTAGTTAVTGGTHGTGIGSGGNGNDGGNGNVLNVVLT